MPNDSQDIPYSTLNDQLRELQTQEPLPDATYYAITLLVTDDGMVERGCQSKFSSWKGDSKHIEIRIARPVMPNGMRDALTRFGQPPAIVNTESDVVVFILTGGNAIIEKILAETYFYDVVGSVETVHSVAEGMVSVKCIPEAWLRNAPSKKARMQILKRDSLRCRICGRSHIDYVDVELHIHHIKPWSKGGLTEELNLITICKTCHDGLDPHYDPGLFALLGADVTEPKCTTASEYQEGVRRYREIVQNALRDDEQD